MAVYIQRQAHMACVRIIVTKPQAIMCDIAVLAETLFSILPGSWMQISLF